MTETEFQQSLIEAAKLHGWRVFHPMPGLSQSGRWTTRTQGHRGFPEEGRRQRNAAQRP